LEMGMEVEVITEGVNGHDGSADSLAYAQYRCRSLDQQFFGRVVNS
jgi:hypothetical protein